MRRYGVLVLAAVVAVVCTRLGFWQLDRLAQRRAFNQRLESKLALPPVLVDPLPADAVLDSSLWFRRAEARGGFDFQRQIVVVGRSVAGTPAVHVTTPLVLSDGGALLVERGWVYSPDSRTAELGALGEPDSAMVQGILMPGVAGRWTQPQGDQWPIYTGSNDPTQFTERFPYPLLRAVLRRTEQPPGAPAGLRPVPLPPITNGPHLSYALQWFAFAVIAVVGSVALYRGSNA